MAYYAGDGFKIYNTLKIEESGKNFRIYTSGDLGKLECFVEIPEVGWTISLIILTEDIFAPVNPGLQLMFKIPPKTWLPAADI